jgi:hypothetical protein
VTSERAVAWLRRAIWAVFLAGWVGFLLVGANRPADPALGPPAPEVAP